MEFILPALIIVAVAGVLALSLWLARRGQAQAPLTLLQNQVNAAMTQSALQMESLQTGLRDEIRRLNEQVARSLTEANRTVGDRLDNAAKVIGDVRQRLGQMDESSRRIFDIGREIAELQQTLRAPKLRGNIGEFMLTDLLAQVLPQRCFSVQHKFKGGEAVDAVIRLSLGLVAVDAKFPLENFKRVIGAASDEEKNAAGKAFIRDVKKHIDAIADKYIRPDEGTLDFAMMYIPAENVYYEIVIKNEWSGEQALVNYALGRRVIPVSPNSFYAYLQTILLGLRGLRVEEHAREIMDSLSRLKKDLDGFVEEFRLVGQHLGNSLKKYAEAEKRLGRVDARLEQMGGMSRSLEGERTAALEAGPDQPPESGA